jgi:thiol-disulfide isomerase/thioredoxin
MQLLIIIPILIILTGCGTQNPGVVKTTTIYKKRPVSPATQTAIAPAPVRETPGYEKPSGRMEKISNLKEFKELISKYEKVFIRFGSEFCRPCRFITPVIEKLASEFPDIQFASIDSDNHADIPSFGSALPALISYHRGDHVAMRSKGVSQKILRALVQQLSDHQKGEEQ